MSVEVKYNGINIVDDIGVVNNVTISDEKIGYPERWGGQNSFDIRGQLTGRCLTFAEYITNANILRNRLSTDFKTFSIVEDGATVLSKPIALIRNLVFDSNQWIGLTPFSATIECYPENEFTGTYGVLEPSNSFSFEEDEEGNVRLIHDISAKGFSTAYNSNALSNAKSFVQGLTGTNSAVAPLFITGHSQNNYCLKTIAENVDRFSATYSVKETYERSEASNGVLKYTTTVDSGIEDGLTKVSLQGEINSCQGVNIATLRTRYNSLDTYGIAQSAYNSITSLSDLNTGALSSGINENVRIPSLSFDINFDNDLRPKTYYYYTTQLSTDILTDISNYNFSINFESRGSKTQRFIDASGLYVATNVGLLVGSGYSGYSLGIPLNPNPNSSGITINRFDGTIGIQSSWDNKPVPPAGLKSWDYQIDVTPSINQFKSTPLIQNFTGSSAGYAVYNMNYKNRMLLSIRGQAQIEQSVGLNAGLALIKSEINALKTAYLVGNRTALESLNFSTGNLNHSGSVGFNVSYSVEGAEFSL